MGKLVGAARIRKRVYYLGESAQNVPRKISKTSAILAAA